MHGSDLDVLAGSCRIYALPGCPFFHAIALVCVSPWHLSGNGKLSGASLARLIKLCTGPSAHARSTVAGSPNLEITIASLDSPDAIQPAVHIWTDSQLKCLKIKDELPKFREEQAAQS